MQTFTSLRSRSYGQRSVIAGQSNIIKKGLQQKGQAINDKNEHVA